MEFSNEELTCKVNKNPNCQVEFDITVHAPLLDKARKEAIKKVKKEVSLPGFRKGKAPTEFVEKKYPGEIEKETQKVMVNMAFSAAMKESDIPLLNQETRVSYSMKEFTPTEAKLTFTYETEPTVPTIEVQKCKIKPPKEKKVTKKEVDEAIRQLKFFFAKWTPVIDRPIEEGDFVIIDLETLEEPKQKVFADTRFEMADKSVAQWMKNLLIGKNVGDKVEGISEPDPDAPEKEKKEFEPKRVLVTIKKAETVELPKLDESFVKQVGATSAEDLKEKMKENLEKKAEEKKESEIRNQVNSFLLSHHFELPESLIIAEKNHRKQELINNPKHEPKWQDLSEDQKKEIEKSLLAQSEEAVRLFYLSRQVVKDAKIDITSEDIENEVKHSLLSLGLMNIDKNKIPKEMYTLAFSKVILKKAQDYIREKAEEQSA